MYFWIGIVFSAIGFSLWIWYELKHPLKVDDDGKPLFRSKRTHFDDEHDEVVKVREAPKLPE